MLRLCIVVFPRLFAETEGTFHTQADNKSRPDGASPCGAAAMFSFCTEQRQCSHSVYFGAIHFSAASGTFAGRLEKPRLCIAVFLRLFAETGDVSHAGRQQKPPGRSESVRGGGGVLFLCGAARVAGRRQCSLSARFGAVHFSVGSGAFAGAGGVFGAAAWDLRRRSFRPYHRIVSTSRTPQKT